VLGEFGDDPDRYHGARARKNYAGNAPITHASGKKTGRPPTISRLYVVLRDSWENYGVM